MENSYRIMEYLHFEEILDDVYNRSARRDNLTTPSAYGVKAFKDAHKDLSTLLLDLLSSNRSVSSHVSCISNCMFNMTTRITNILIIKVRQSLYELSYLHNMVGHCFHEKGIRNE